MVLRERRGEAVVQPLPPPVDDPHDYKSHECQLGIPSGGGFSGGVMQGPTLRCNYAVGGRLIVGAQPETPLELLEIMSRGRADVFVCLSEQVPWYFDHFRRFSVDGLPGGTAPDGRKQIAAVWLHFPMDDFTLPGDPDVVRLVEELERLIREDGKVIYMHCFSGVGRTQLVATPLLLLLYPGLMTEGKARHLLNEYRLHGREKPQQRAAKAASGRADGDIVKDIFRLAASIRSH